MEMHQATNEHTHTGKPGGSMTYRYKNLVDDIKLAVWDKAETIDNYDPNVWRRDAHGHVIRYDEHGRRTDYGWQVDRIVPYSQGGSSMIENLRPLWWKYRENEPGGSAWH